MDENEPVILSVQPDLVKRNCVRETEADPSEPTEAELDAKHERKHMIDKMLITLVAVISITVLNTMWAVRTKNLYDEKERANQALQEAQDELEILKRAWIQENIDKSIYKKLLEKVLRTNQQPGQPLIPKDNPVMNDLARF